MYEIKFFKHPGKIKTHWLGPYVVKAITDGGAMKLEKLDATEVKGLINGSRLKPYFDNYDQVQKNEILTRMDRRREKNDFHMRYDERSTTQKKNNELAQL